MKYRVHFLMASFVLVLLTGLDCKQNHPIVDTSTITIRLNAAPEKVDPLRASTLTSRQVSELLFMPLLDFDPGSLELRPMLAKELPEIDTIFSGKWAGGRTYAFEIRPEAKWANGQPITGADYLFTLKCLLNPGIGAAPWRSYFNFFKDLSIQPDNDKKFVVTINQPYILALESLGNIGIYPKHIYDPNGLMDEIKISDLANLKTADSLFQNNKNLQDFANYFNQKTLENTEGSGAYRFSNFDNNQNLQLALKPNFWANQHPHLPDYLKADIDQIIFKIIPDINTAISLLHNQELDILTGIPATQLPELKNKLRDEYDFYTPQKLAYDYIGINGNNPVLGDSLTRRALAHLVDVDLILKDVINGAGQRLTNPIHPSKPYYNHTLQPIAYHLEKAKALFKKAGWTLNKNGILERPINGKLMTLQLRYYYKSTNSTAEQVGILLAEAARKAGVKISPEGLELKALLTQYRQRDYDLIYLTWARPPGLDDLRQTWHTSASIPGGTNRTGFGDDWSDRIIDKIRVTDDKENRKELYLRVQEIIYNRQPYIFLYTPLEIMAIRKKWHLTPSVKYPGYAF